MTKSFKMKFLDFIKIIPLYFIVGNKSIFLYVLSICLYNILNSIFDNISIREGLQEVYYNYSKNKIFKRVMIITGLMAAIGIVISLVVGNLLGQLLHIENTFLVFLLMGISIYLEYIIKFSLEYLETFNSKKLSRILYDAFYYIDIIIFLIMALIFFRITNTPVYLANAFLYLSKIISFIMIFMVFFLSLKSKQLEYIKRREEVKVDSILVVKNIFKNINISLIIKNIYYYISVIILYFILSGRYNYMINDIEVIISFIYFYGISVINMITDFVFLFVNYFNKKETIFKKIYVVFDRMLSVAIILAIIAPLLTKVVFNNTSNSIYLMMLGFMGIFISLYNLTFKNINNKKFVYISLCVGLLIKILLMIPLVDSFYRIGYNLIYGDVISTILGMFMSIIINYIYLKKHNYEKGFFEKILKSLYENIVLCIVLVILQFLIPINSNSYFRALGLIMAYVSISLMILNVQKKEM